jgi:hypothetical protein
MKIFFLKYLRYFNSPNQSMMKSPWSYLRLPGKAKEIPTIVSHTCKVLFFNLFRFAEGAEANPLEDRAIFFHRTFYFMALAWYVRM